MMELMNDLSLELNEERRREVALDTMHAAHATNDVVRRSVAFGLVAVGQWLATEPAAELEPSPARSMQVTGDCV